MSEFAIVDHQAVLSAVTPADAIRRVEEAFVRHRRGDWVMPAKVYVDSPPHGDFRAMPVRGDGLAAVKWVTSFPGNPARGLPTVAGVLVVSDATTGEPLAALEAGAVTALRTGAVAAVAARALASAAAATVGLIGCGLNGAYAARCLAAAGYGPGVCNDSRQEAAEAVAAELGWRAGSRTEALGCDVVCCVTPGTAVVVEAGDLRPGMHLNMLGADAPSKAEATVGAVASCALFCDEWQQASHGGELHGAVAAGLVGRDRVTELGAVLDGAAGGRPGPEAVTMFDSTGLAIQDLAIAAAIIESLRAGRLDVPRVGL